MKKLLLWCAVLLALSAPILAKGTQDAQASTDSGELIVWSSGDELGRFVEGFNKIYPNIKVSITVVPNDDFLAKLSPAIASGNGVPDIFTGESDYVRYLVETPYWADLRRAPYNAESFEDDVWEYVKAVGTDSKGTLKALSWQASPGSIIYRRDLAKKVLGVDDPVAVSALLASNQSLLETAAKFKDAGIRMFASWQDIWNMQFSNRKSAWIDNGKLMIDPSMDQFMDMAKEIVSKGYDLSGGPWSPEWVAAVEADDVFCYVLPTWGYQFVVKPNAVKTAGQWGLAQGPVPYVKGGTWLGIYAKTPKKELAWKFMEYVTGNTEAQRSYASQYGEYVALKSVDEDLATGEGESVLAGQNLFAFYNDQMSKIPDHKMTGYDGQINNAFLSATKAYAEGSMDKAAAVAQFKADVANAYPDLVP